jgi:hypothetical protein
VEVNKNKPKLITEKASMHLISSPFFSFDLQYDQQIEAKKQQGLLPLNQ